ncbi:hypothetical protein [Deinococcus peraridilitoris]|uniref:Copper amine oxidase family protein n=1 Tax=Deinococcus peraridilitoris (strain DSM 19664 / LMG 22246 / CIP 109416 / KR-200) TaxID=937777 RepID=K9ZY89_DEIPD|nr:hypothetical protein [Deinococcus peraridilitoris]AFZ66566.1 hypothetical protein Deipe_1002 [Deinococcus peraridilitoris DSM 19664]
MSARSRSFFLSLLLFFIGFASASRQLILAADNPNATVNGQPRVLNSPPRLQGGRLLVPLVETLTLAGLPAVSVHDAPLEETRASSFNGALHVDVRWLASKTGSTLVLSTDGRNATLSTPQAPALDPGAPQARFAPEKTVYAPGEKINMVDYSFDPDGQTISKRTWTGRQDAFFTPGEYLVSLQVTNAQGKVSAPFSRMVRVQGAPVATPLEFSLRHTPLSEPFADPLVLNYPSLTARSTVEANFPLLFSDSPEKPTSAGVLYRDSVVGRARLLAYHVNGLASAARVYVVIRNLEGRAVRVRTLRFGETAPSRVEGTLGQVALMDFFTSQEGAAQLLPAGQLAVLYASPRLTPGSGVSLLQDVESDGRIEVSFVILPEGVASTPEALASLVALPLDGVHQRGTFPGAVRRLQVALGALPARLNIGDGQHDQAIPGVDALTGTPMRLAGNYGVLYEVEVTGAANTVMALSPRGGGYRGALQLFDGPASALMRVPRSGVLTKPDVPLLLWRTQTERLNFSFVPANGSNLPVSLVFYRLNR